jgi:hypothetical protein
MNIVIILSQRFLLQKYYVSLLLKPGAHDAILVGR